jgi:class 3 adenylate cyclase
MRRTWTWTFDLPPDRLWPVLADTNRFNEAMGLPPYTLEQTPQSNGTILRRGRGKAAGFTLEWEEKPYEWIAGRHFRQSRVFTKGPFRLFGPVFDIESDGKGGSHVTYALEWEPLSVVGRVLGARLAEQAGQAVGKRTLEAVAFARGERDRPFDLPPPELPSGARERAMSFAREIDRSPYGNGLGARLAEIVLSGMATDLTHMRPKALAGELGVGPRTAIEACLAGVRAGLLTMKWGLLCPNCRGAKLSVAALSELPRGAHCPSCNIDYERDFEQNVELWFAPASTVRPLRDGGFCLSGPMGTPHVAVQVLLQPGERRDVAVELPPGAYRLRTLHPGLFVDVEYDSGMFPGLHITASGVEVLNSTDQQEEGTSVTFVNDADFELAALIEDRTWVRDAAYNIVREHFALLAAIVRDQDGAVVKTIGDAVMASFNDPAQAVRAALAMQVQIRESGQGVRDLVLKVGVHAGPSVVVTLNDRLDYFGSTVNMAARLQGQSTGGDIVLSHAVADDPTVRDWLASTPKRREAVTLKGFAEPVEFVRLVDVTQDRATPTAPGSSSDAPR